MKLLEKILLPTDFHGSSDRSIDMAIDLAKRFNSEIILLHVLTDNSNFNQYQDLIKKESERQLQAVHSKITDNEIQKVTQVIRKGNKFHEINQLAEEEDVNMILIGSGEMGSKDKSRIGTTTKRVIETSTKPVWVMTEQSTGSIKSIVCPVDLSAPSRRALKNAIHLARHFKARLTILYVTESFRDLLDGLEVKLEGENTSNEFEKELSGFLKGFDFYDVNWEKKLLLGKPATEILKALEGHGSETLLVMGTTGRTGLNKLLVGSVTEKVTRALPCSFITMKQEDFIVVKMNADLHDLEYYFKQGMEMLENGLPKEALNQFRLGISINDLHAPSWDGMALAYARLQDDKNAEHSRKHAKEIRTRLEEQKIIAEIRSKHWLAGGR